MTQGRVVEVLEPSPERVEPRCSRVRYLRWLQSAAPGSRRLRCSAKQQALLDALQHIGKVSPAQMLPPLVGESPWGYRRKARLGVRYVPKKGGVLVGFRERSSSFVAEVETCHILHPRVGELLPALSRLIDGLSIREQIPQIEMAMGDSVCVLIFRLLATPSEEDRKRLLAFGPEHQW